MFFKKDFGGGTYAYCIVGLGNPGQKYQKTRHNAGFLCLDLLSKQFGTGTPKKKFDAFVQDATIAGNRCLLVWPQTYMNNSGQAVSKILQFYKLTTKQLLVIFDDISLEPGRLRIRREGSHGGHNGIKDIVALCGGQDFPRIKIGVGGATHPGYDLKDWVLSTFSKEEQPAIGKALEDGAKAAECILKSGIDTAMNLYNR